MDGEQALLREELITFDVVVEKEKMWIVVVYSLENENLGFEGNFASEDQGGDYEP